MFHPPQNSTLVSVALQGLPKVLLLDRLSDIAAPVAEAVRQQLFHDRLKHEQDCVDSYDVEATVSFIQVNRMSVVRHGG